MRVAIVGAGVAGLAAARTLVESGAGVVLFEKSRIPGGRLATRQVGNFIFDTGATSIAPRGLGIEGAMLRKRLEQIHEIVMPVHVRQLVRQDRLDLCGVEMRERGNRQHHDWPKRSDDERHVDVRELHDPDDTCDAEPRGETIGRGLPR